MWNSVDIGFMVLWKKVASQKIECQEWYKLPIHKGKGDPMEFGSYRGIKLLDHVMKVVERIFK